MAPCSRLEEKLRKLGLSTDDGGCSRSSPASKSKHHFRIFFPLPPYDGLQFNALRSGTGFNFTGQLLGVGGKQLQRIKQESAARVEVNNAEGNLNGSHPDPLDPNLHALISADSVSKLHKAAMMVWELLAPVNGKFLPIDVVPGGSVRLTVAQPGKAAAAAAEAVPQLKQGFKAGRADAAPSGSDNSSDSSSKQELSAESRPVARPLEEDRWCQESLLVERWFRLGDWAGATLGALGLAARAYQRNAVTPAGAFAVAAACLATLGCSLRFGVVMLAYAYTSHKLRQYKEARQAVDFEFVVKPQQLLPRDWPEVLSIAAVPTVLAVAYGAMAGCLDLPLGTLPAVETWRADLLTLFQGAVLGWYACCCGDAWSRELGELSGDMPRLLTTLQPVRKGTHGAVTLLGLSGAAAGGLLVGLLFHCAAVLSPTLWVFEVQRMAAMSQWRIIPLGLIAGVCGSLVDSLLGALLQFTGFDSSTSSLTNTPGPKVSRISGFAYPWLNDHLVNVLAASLTAVLTALAALRMFG
ncbi:hypothetical protein OEZ85_003958 [Tetradesmus obliquus]|uniref:KHDC4/BBP-like KH-domain type I domain-containing protein n=1 Tax=Tetradesmus obliquus TaxID=3088 RepID=A0ABY8UFX3_TETOB|nr:hypothetical protein OEZ85_003958 [Tetradesmus obliquus]